MLRLCGVCAYLLAILCAIACGVVAGKGMAVVNDLTADAKQLKGLAASARSDDPNRLALVVEYRRQGEAVAAYADNLFYIVWIAFSVLLLQTIVFGGVGALCFTVPKLQKEQGVDHARLHGLSKKAPRGQE